MSSTTDLFYHWDLFIGGLVQDGLMLGILLLIVRGGPARELLALRRPRSWLRAAGWMLLVLVAIWILGAILEPFLHAGDEQGLVPEKWRPEEAAPFAANLAFTVLAVPVVEEMLFRGAGYSLLVRSVRKGGRNRGNRRSLRPGARPRGRAARARRVRARPGVAAQPHGQRLSGDDPPRHVQRARHHPRGERYDPAPAHRSSPACCSSPRPRPRTIRRDGQVDGAADRQLPRGGGVVPLPLGLRRRDDRQRAPSSTTSTRSPGATARR